MKKLLLAFISILLLLVLSGCCLSHEWAEASCSVPKTCTKCGKSEGDVLPHTWTNATCTNPKTCSECGVTEGETLPHTWVDATCDNPKTCDKCNTTEGEALGHTWEDATCVSAKTCSTCNETSGTPLDHNYEWTTSKEPTYTSEGEKQGICKDCGNSMTETIDAIVPEYHWNTPVSISENLSIGMYNNGTDYWIEIKSKTMNSSTILSAVLRNKEIDFGFDVEGFLEWAEHIANRATDSWKSNGITYAEMSGYGRVWVFYMDLRDDTSGIIGMKVNSEKEFEAAVGIEVKD